MAYNQKRVVDALRAFKRRRASAAADEVFMREWANLRAARAWAVPYFLEDVC